MSDPEKKGADPRGTDALKRRGGNVGQSGRWRRQEEGAGRYGNEERWHSTEQAGTEERDTPQAREDSATERTDRKSNSSGEAREGAAPGSSIAPEESRWLDERAEGQDKKYGRGDETASKTKKTPA